MSIRTVKKLIKKQCDEIFKNEVERSITVEIIIEFTRTNSRFVLSGIKINKTIKLIIKVAHPIDKFNFFDNPSSRTTHEAFPIFE